MKCLPKVLLKNFLISLTRNVEKNACNIILMILLKKYKDMTIVSTKEFSANQEKYFDMAINENVCIQRGDNMFYLSYAPFECRYPEQPVLEPDDDFRRALSAEEFRKRLIVVLKGVDKKYSKK
jgi:hypothetical protein